MATAMSEKSSFRVIIVGGSIAGLSLANMLEKAGINFMVLEKHENIAPQIGASISIGPSSERILDQLGCYETLEKLSSPVNIYSFYDENGNATHHDTWGSILDESFGYRIRFLHRQQLIQTLFDNLSDKSKVLTSHAVERIEQSPDGVVVETTSGDVFTGSIVVGADGVQSRVAQEMQRFAEQKSLKLRSRPLKNAFECSCRCIFGISKPSQPVVEDQMLNVSNKNRNYFCAGGTDGQMYWFAFVNNEKPTRGSAIERYTEADKESLAATFKDDIIKPGLTFGDLYESQMISTLVPIEEGLLDRCFHGRIVLTGDSWHKVHPITGQGGNQAIISSAYLANKLNELKSAESIPDHQAIEKVFLDYQTFRGIQARASVKAARFLQWTGTLATPISAFLQRNVVSKTSTEEILVRFTQSTTSAVPLKYLPMPTRKGRIPWNDDIALKPHARSRTATMIWVVLLFFTMAIHYKAVDIAGPAILSERRPGVLFKLLNILDTSGFDGSQRKELQFNMSVATVALCMYVESHRFYIPKALSSVLPFVIAASFLGWQYIIPIYFALYVWFSGDRLFYYPTPMAMDYSVGNPMIIAYLFTYLPALGFTIKNPNHISTSWPAAHIMFPILSSCFHKLIVRRSPAGNRRNPGVFDNKYIWSVYSVLLLNMALSVAAPLISGKDLYQIYGRALMGSTIERDEARIASIDWAILIFMIFSLWELHRVNIAAKGVFEGMLWIIATPCSMAPSLVLMKSWLGREKKWKQARQATPTESKKSSDTEADRP
ncbi:uncharacterized protein N7511_002487 [Penicillium nucicola]|uniref:uncharacterized protein n=1 Tax=Penicillium nucicola TaxID=1850975 RepID=UPI002545317C|nr:uncharacterized protein N7511_002487 [Penicillium nucicola]KAJ5770436.1 hypothetical protein N7511_002487 [Penicillium nucicola]